MNGFIEQRVQKLNVNKGSNKAVLIFGGIFFLILGGLIAFASIIMLIKEKSGQLVGPLALGLAFLAVGILIMRMASKRSKRKKEAKKNPYLFVETYGIENDMKAAIQAFNKAYEEGSVRQYPQHGEGTPVWITSDYILVDSGLTLKLGDLSQLIWVHYGITTTGYKNRSYRTYDHTLFFRGGEKASCLNISGDESAAGEIRGALEALGKRISDDTKMNNLAFKDWKLFQEWAEGFNS